MPMQVGLVGLPNSGKTTLFNALTHAGAEVTAYASVSEKANVGVATITDERLDEVARVVASRKVTPAAIRVMDFPGTGGSLVAGLRESDALLAVADGFSPDASPERDLDALRLELLVADRDHVERRLERVRKEAKSGDPARRQDVDTLEGLLAHLEAGNTLADWSGELPPELEPLTTMPLIAIVNGPGGIDCKLELELADLPPEEAALGLIVFFTAGDTEARSWTLRQGQTALDAAESIHTDIARGFIRCEVIRWDDLVSSGSHAEAARRGQQRLEGKSYVVEDGDVLNTRFNV
jgi:ribosome-binding ATPase